MSDDPGFIESDRRDGTVDGRTAVRQEMVATGEGLHHEGLTMVRWSVDLGEQTLLAQTHDIGDARPVNELVFVGDFEANMSWVVGVDTPDPFAVAMFENPTRLVVDIVHDG